MELCDRDVFPNVNVSQQANGGGIEHPVQGRNDAFDAGVVGGDAVADEAKRCGHLLKQVDFHGAAGLHE